MSTKKTTSFDQLRALALRAAASASSQISTLANTVTAALEEMDDNKADKADGVAVSIPVSAWKANSDSTTKAAGFDYYADAAVSGLLATDSADTILAIPSLSVASAAGMATTAVPSAGKVRYYAVNKPTAALSATVRVIQGAT